MRVWHVQYVDKEFYDSLADPLDPQLAAVARDALEAQGHHLAAGVPVIEWMEITRPFGDLRKGDYILRIGFREADERRRETP